jgi:hypothetical protein
MSITRNSGGDAYFCEELAETTIRIAFQLAGGQGYFSNTQIDGPPDLGMTAGAVLPAGGVASRDLSSMQIECCQRSMR